MSKETTGQVFGLMDNLLEKIRTEKRAAQKKATDGSAPTSHSVMNAPDGTHPAHEGSRSAENAEDIRKDYGVLGNTGQEDANSASSENQADSIGTQSQSSDEVKGNVEKPKTPSTEVFGGEEEKYATAIKAGNKLLTLLASSMGKFAEESEEEETEESENANEEETEEVYSEESDTEDTEKVPTSKDKEEKAAGLRKKAGLKKTAEELKKEAAQLYREEAEAGYMAAGLLAEQLGFGKEASDEQTAINASLEGIIKAAQDDAVLLSDYLQGIEEGQVKAATANRKAFRKIAQPGMEGMDLGEALPEEGGAGIPAAALMGGGGEGGGEGGGGGESGGDDAAAIEMLAQALAEAGIGPEELAAIAEGGGGGGGGGEEVGEPAPDGEGLAEASSADGEPLAEELAAKEANLKFRAKRKLMALLSR